MEGSTTKMEKNSPYPRYIFKHTVRGRRHTHCLGHSQRRGQCWGGLIAELWGWVLALLDPACHRREVLRSNNDPRELGWSGEGQQSQQVTGFSSPR